MRILFALAMALGCALAMAQSVTLGGSMGDKALLVINGTPRMVALGATVQGVKLVSVGASEAAIEVQGRRMTLQMGGAPASLGGAASDGNGSAIVLTATWVREPPRRTPIRNVAPAGRLARIFRRSFVVRTRRPAALTMTSVGRSLPAAGASRATSSMSTPVEWAAIL